MAVVAGRSVVAVTARGAQRLTLSDAKRSLRRGWGFAWSWCGSTFCKFCRLLGVTMDDDEAVNGKGGDEEDESGESDGADGSDLSEGEGESESLQKIKKRESKKDTAV